MLSQKKQYIYLLFIYIISNLLLFFVNVLASAEHSYIDGLHKLSHECIILQESPLTKLLTSVRGSKYYTLTLNQETRASENRASELDADMMHKRRYCLMTLWAFTHVWLYIIIGFYCPKLFLASFFVGILFECFEGYFFQCHDLLDIGFNSLGFFIGYYLQQWFFKKGAFTTLFRPSLAVFGLSTLLIAYWLFCKIIKYQGEHLCA